MNKCLEWWKTDQRYLRLLKAFLAACLPILCCLAYCAAQGRSITDVYLPGSEWNDELFYYKQVEGILKYGYPQGYFGFNESHGLKLSFAAWSPVLVAPWLLWGLVFGWNLLSPVLCNIVLLTLAVFLFMWLVCPTWKQLGIFTLLFCLYTPFVRYMLSVMPEITCFALLIIFYGLAINYLERERGYKLCLLFVLSGVLTLMRPYMLLFLLLPAVLLVRAWRQKGRGWLGILPAAGIVAAVLVLYALIKHYLGAEYFAPLFFTDWVTVFFTEGIGAGIHNFFSTLYWKGRDFLRHTMQGFRSGLASGAFFGGYLVMMAVLLWQSLADWRTWRKLRRAEGESSTQQAGAEVFPGRPQAGIAVRKGAEPSARAQKRKKVGNFLAVEAHLAFSFVAMLFALLLMYKLTEGSKHLLTFLAAGLCIVSLMKTRFYKKAMVVGVVFAYLYSYMAVDPYDYQVPFAEEERQAQVFQWQEIFTSRLELSPDNVPNYDNVVIWTWWDETSKGRETVKWQLLYGLPEGFGISCCGGDYVKENFGSLQSRYLVTVAGGEADRLCQEAGYAQLGRDEDMVLYARY